MKKTDETLHPAQKFIVERVQRSQLKNAPYNPRQIDEHARKKLKENIKKKGLRETLVWNKRTGHLVSGHQRISILDELSKTGDKYSLDVVVLDCDEKDEKEQNLFFNNPSTQGTYDPELLGKMLADGVDYKVSGFDDMDIQMHLEGTDYEVTMFDDDKAPDSVKDDLEQLEEIQRMKRERKAHRERDQDANDPEFFAVVVFPDRDAQGQFMERIGMDKNDRYVDGVRLHTSLEASRPRTKTYDGEKFVELKFWVAEDQKTVIEDELTRISSLIKGKNLRGRALEAMAVISSQTPTDNIMGEEESKPKPKFKKKRG